MLSSRSSGRKRRDTLPASDHLWGREGAEGSRAAWAGYGGSKQRVCKTLVGSCCPAVPLGLE